MCSRGIKSTGFASGALGVGWVVFALMLSLSSSVARVSGVAAGSGLTSGVDSVLSEVG